MKRRSLKKIYLVYYPVGIQIHAFHDLGSDVPVMPIALDDIIEMLYQMLRYQCCNVAAYNIILLGLT